MGGECRKIRNIERTVLIQYIHTTLTIQQIQLY